MNDFPEINLPRPTDRLANCHWLPRILAKARLLTAGLLPEEYARAFCHPAGVDEQFLRYFELTKEQVMAQADQSDEAVAEWFLSCPTRKARIDSWNPIALNLGRPGFPMADLLPIALSTNYKHLKDRDLATVFEVLEADEAKNQ